MQTQELLRATVAEFLQIEADQVRAELPLAGRRLQGSIGRAALDAALRRCLGASYPAVYSAATYGELEATILSAGDATNPVLAFRPGPVPPLADANSDSPDSIGALGLSCGVDLEMVESLPAAADYWTDEFYRTTFSPAEIAYCVLQQDPRLHFAARWCAKEALRKCDGAFLHVPLGAVELIHDGTGRPHLRRVADAPGQLLPVAVSISHTPVAAVATVIKLDAPTPAPAPAAAADPLARPSRSLHAWAATLFSLAAVGLALWALLRTVVRDA